MEKQKVINIVTWIVTIITVMLWLPVLAIGVFMIKCYITQSDGTSIGIIGGADGPTSIYVNTFAFVGGVSDFIILGAMLTLTIILWYIKIKLKRSRSTCHKN